jgi:glycosyltransferase involved in cell wall biosynthesis
MKVAVCGITPRSQHFLTYVRFLVDRDHEVTVLTDTDTVDAPVQVVNVARPAPRLPVEVPGWGFVVLLWRLWRALHAERFDVLDVMQVTPLGVYAACLWSGPLVLDFWGTDVLGLSVRPLRVRLLMRLAVHKADRIHAVSRQMSREIVALGAAPGRVASFQYGIDLSMLDFVPTPRRSEQILSSRGLREFYRGETVIRAMPLVLERRPGARLVVTKDDGPLESLRALSAELGVDHAVTFLGRVARDQLPGILRSCAVWVSIPPSDGAPLSLLEAMAAGLLPVVSDLETMHEWLDEGRAVFVTRVTPEEVARALLRGLDLAESGEHAPVNRRFVEEHGDRRTNLPRWEALLAEAAAARRRGASWSRLRDAAGGWRGPR